MLLLALVAPALANGQTSHLWITEAALEKLPEGDLRDLLTREDLRPWLRNGTMFPDGGYAVGDDYGEMAHWEPFQDLYLDWIRDTYAPPWSDEAAQHIAFLMGLASHGMADQVYDALYLEEGRIEDSASDWDASPDEAADVVFASLTGPQDIPDDVVPYDLLAELFASEGHEVSVQTIEQGQSLLRVAVTLVGEMGQHDSAVEMYTAQFPWVTGHQLDPLEHGNPPDEATVIALYWQVIWERLQGEDWMTDPVIATFPASDADGLALDASDYDARPAVVFARGAASGSFDDSLLDVQGPDGAVPVSTDLYYGSDSHVVLIVPQQDWVEDAHYTATVSPGVSFRDETVLDEPWSWTFRAGDPVPEDTGQPADSAEDVTKEGGCGCATTPGTRLGGLILAGIAGLLSAGRRRRGRGPS